MLESIDDMELAFNVGGTRFKANMKDVLRIDTDNMLEELITHPQVYAYIASVRVEVDTHLAEMVADRERLYGNRMITLSEVTDNTGKKLTVAAKDAYISQDEQLIEADNKIAEVRITAQKMAVFCKALDMKGSMLSQAANWISRTETPPYVESRRTVAPESGIKRRKPVKTED